MAENIVKGFQTDKGVELYDYNSLANKPTLITQAQLDAVKIAANKYTDEEIAKLDLTGGSTVELDTTLKEPGKAADAKSVGDALNNKLNSDQLQPAINAALAQAKQSGEFDGPQGPQGEQGLQGIQGIQGEQGPAGDNGISINHNWNGTILTITSASGTSSSNLQGPQGEQGVQGIQGEQGPQGPQGEPGITPQKGRDYFTETEIQEIVNQVVAKFTNVSEVGA